MSIATIVRHWLNPPRRSQRTNRLDGVSVTLYTREGCGCCETAKKVLQSRQRTFGFELIEVDVDRDPQLVQEYGTTVPVVALDGRVRFRGKVDPVLLDRLLEGESRHKFRPS